jgi:hypothetical protein
MILELQPINWSQIQYSSVKSSAFFNDGSSQRSKNAQLSNFQKKNY